MVKLGVSVYPEQESAEELASYLERVAAAGFKKVFTSMFSVDEGADALVERFGSLAARVHELGMELSVDVNPMLFDRIGAAADNLEIFHRMGIDVLRMDMPFFDERNAALIENPYGIGIEFNAMMEDLLCRFIPAELMPKVAVCHNFYPQRFTAESVEAYCQMNAFWKARGARVGAFVSSQSEGARGPWPVREGLPTVEGHRDMPLELQIRHMLLLGDVDEILIGNEPATDEELAAVGALMRKISGEDEKEDRAADDPTRQFDGLAALFGAGERTLLHIDLDGDISAVERSIALDYRRHSDGGDGTEYMLRSRMTRMSYRGQAVEPRPWAEPMFHRGDIVVVNDNLEHYRAELQVVLKDMPNDGQRNHIGRIVPEELFLLDVLGSRITFLLEEA